MKFVTNVNRLRIGDESDYPNIQAQYEGCAMTQLDRRNSRPKLTLVIPCNNEEQMLPETATRLCELLEELTRQKLISKPSIFFVDDGSKDTTWAVIERLAKSDSRIHGIKLSRNFGQQSAILAGLLTVPGEVLISMDADLQDDVTAIEEMVRSYVCLFIIVRNSVDISQNVIS